MGFKSFKADFYKEFEDKVYNFIDQSEYSNKSVPFNGKLVVDLDETEHDSYGYENTTLKRIFHFEDYGIYVEFYGNRSSYQGEEWYGYKEVIKSTKTISIWKQVN